MTHRVASLLHSLLFWGLAGVGLWLASSAALRESPGPGGIDALELARALERERAVALVGFTAGDARRMRAAWVARGIGTADGEMVPRVVFLAPQDRLAIDILRRTGLESLPGGPAIDLTHDAVTITCEDPERPGVASSFVIGTAGSATVGAAVEGLARGLPPTRPALTARTAQGLRIERGLTPSGTPDRSNTVITRAIDDLVFDTVTDTNTGTLLSVESGSAPGTIDVARRVAAEVAKAHGNAHRPGAQAVEEIRIVRTVDARSVDGTVDGVAWYEPHGGRLVGIAGVRGLEFDLVHAYTSWLDNDGAREVAERVRASDGTDVSTEQRVRRSLPRAVAVRLSGSASRATGPGTRHTLRQLERIAALGFGAVVLDVRVPLGPPAGSPAGLPAGPGAGADHRRALELASRGRSVTVEGDGAVLATAVHAGQLGLEVVVWPRFVAGPSGPLATQQIHPSGPAVEALSRRYALAVEGVARLAERAGASALVLLEPGLLPLADTVDPAVRSARRSLRRQAIGSAAVFQGELLAFASGVPPLERAAVVADLTPVAGSPFGLSFGFEVGELGAITGNPAGAYRHRLQVASAAAAGRLHAIDVRLDGKDAARRDALLRACSTVVSEMPEIDLVVLSYWGLGRPDPRHDSTDAQRVIRDVRVVPDDVLREFASVR